MNTNSSTNSSKEKKEEKKEKPMKICVGLQVNAIINKDGKIIFI